MLKCVVVGRFGPLNVVYSLASGPCGIIDDAREVLLLDDDAKKIPTITLASEEFRTYKINSISVIFTFFNSVSSIPISICASLLQLNLSKS